MPEVRLLQAPSEKGYPTRVRFDPSGERVFALGTNRRLTVLPREGGKPKGVAGMPWAALAFSPDGSHFVMGEDTVSLFDAASLKKVWGHKASFAKCAAFSPDGKEIVYGTANAAITRLDAATGKKVPLRVQSSSMNVSDLAFSADGKYLFAANSLGCIDRFDMTDNERVSSPREPWIQSVALAHDDSLLATGAETWPAGEHPITGKWNASTHVVVRAFDLTELRTLHVGDDAIVPGGATGVNGAVRRARFVPGTTKLVALYVRSDGAFLHCWEARDGAVISMERLAIHALDLDVAADGTIVIAAKEGVFLWA
jgi:hypothetical protein